MGSPGRIGFRRYAWICYLVWIGLSYLDLHLSAWGLQALFRWQSPDTAFGWVAGMLVFGMLAGVVRWSLLWGFLGHARLKPAIRYTLYAVSFALCAIVLLVVFMGSGETARKLGMVLLSAMLGVTFGGASGLLAIWLIFWLKGGIYDPSGYRR